MDELLNKFGFCEMYEWAEVPLKENRIGRFVQFDKFNPNKIRLCENTENIVGVTTVNSVINSDDPNHWAKENLSNDYGDVYVNKETLAVGNKEYDQYNEFSYIKTLPWEHYVAIKNSQFDKNKKYIKRSNRNEWVRVNLLGKVIVKDNGKCKPGGYCTLYTGKLQVNQGTVIPATSKSKVKFYVLERISPTTVLILNK